MANKLIEGAQLASVRKNEKDAIFSSWTGKDEESYLCPTVEKAGGDGHVV